MNFKKLCAGLMSGIMAVGMFTGTFSFNKSAGTDGNSAKTVLDSIFSSVEPMKADAAANSSFRRVINNESPVWIVHIDSWNYPDPEKIIDLVPEDVLPYVVFNVSLYQLERYRA